MALASAAAENGALSGIIALTGHFMSLHSASTSTTGANEIGTTTRQSVTWGTPSGGSVGEYELDVTVAVQRFVGRRTRSPLPHIQRSRSTPARASPLNWRYGHLVALSDLGHPDQRSRGAGE
jgi:hypothetical protein